MTVQRKERPGHDLQFAHSCVAVQNGYVVIYDIGSGIRRTFRVEDFLGVNDTEVQFYRHDYNSVEDGRVVDTFYLNDYQMVDCLNRALLLGGCHLPFNSDYD